MSARFEIRRAFPLPERELLALAGTVLEGTATAGMTARLRDEESGFEQPVHAVEFLGEEAGAPGPPSPCLTFHARDASRLAEWMALDWEGRTVELTW
jgi:hypothetical protein